MSTELKCPARHHGWVGTCRSCIYVAGGPSDLCMEMRKAWEREKAQAAQDGRSQKMVMPGRTSTTES